MDTLASSATSNNANCALDGVSLYPTYRKPFDLIFKRAKTEDWYTMEIREPVALLLQQWP